MPTTTKLRSFKQPANLPGHRYAGPLSLSGAGGRMPNWKAAPFVGTAASGTKTRLSERVQAQADRIQIMKAHYVQTKQQFQKLQQKLSAEQKALRNLRVNQQNARAMARGSRSEENRAKWRRKLEDVKTRAQHLREDHADTAHAMRMSGTELKKLDREISKISQRLLKNKAKKRAT